MSKYVSELVSKYVSKYVGEQVVYFVTRVLQINNYKIPLTNMIFLHPAQRAYVFLKL